MEKEMVALKFSPPRFPWKTVCSLYVPPWGPSCCWRKSKICSFWSNYIDKTCHVHSLYSATCLPSINTIVFIATVSHSLFNLKNSVCFFYWKEMPLFNIAAAFFPNCSVFHCVLTLGWWLLLLSEVLQPSIRLPDAEVWTGWPSALADKCAASGLV